MEFSLYGVLEWVLAKNLKVVEAQSVSNILISLYFLSFLFNRKAVFIMAFLLVELVGLLSPVDYITGCGMDCDSYEYYYLMYAILYALCYWVIFKKTKSIKICSGYVILILFELHMSYNEWIRPQIETIAYTYYEYIVMVIHIYIISTITKCRKVNVFSRNLIASIRSKLSYGYSVSFFCYTIQQSYLKNKKLCR